MIGLIKGLVARVKKIVGLLLPFGRRAAGTKVSPAVRWTVHVIFVALVLVGLFFVSEALGLDRLIPIRNRLLAKVWLPLLVLLVYLFLWAGWWLWKLWTSEEVAEHFPDIEEAWDEAVQALSRAGIALTEVPVFLVLGRPEAPEASLFQAARLDLAVKQTPSRPDAPLHVYGHRDAVYVTCANVSLLGRFAANLALENLQDWPGPHDVADEGPEQPTGTLIPGVSERQTLRSAAEEDVVAVGRPGTALERRSKRRLLKLRIPDLRADRQTIEETAARLRFLCTLIARDRQPYCPINGILLLVPLGAADGDDEARQAAELCGRDLDTVRDTFRLRCPLYALVCDLETTWGFYEFLKHQKTENKLQRLGQRFPLATELGPALLREQIESSTEYLCNQLVRDWVYHLFRVESDPSQRPNVVQTNTRLFRLLHVMNDRAPRLAFILKNALLPPEEAPGVVREPWFYGGCYVAATGADKDHEQAFVRGVLDRLHETQEFVCWTTDAVQEDAASHAQTTYGYVALAGVWVAAGIGVVWRLWFSGT